MSRQEFKKLWACNDAITDLNCKRLSGMDLWHGLSAALVSYDGIQYQYMAPDIFEDLYFDYVQEHLRILSEFYGILRPLDGVIPYGLEMQAKLAVENSKNLYFYALEDGSYLYSDGCVEMICGKAYEIKNGGMRIICEEETLPL